MGEPQRTCLVTGETLSKEELLRFVADPDGRIVVDVEAKLPGRGLWLTPKRSVLAEAIKRNAFARGAKAPVTLPDDLGAIVEERLKQKLTDTLHLCKKAGVLTQGFEKVKTALLKEKVAVLLHASDASHDGKAKLNKYCTEQVKRIEYIDRALLSEVLGREDAVHLALAPHKITQYFWQNAQRFAGFIELDTV